MQLAGFVVGPYQTNCYAVINTETHEGFVVDPGMGAAPQVRELFAQHQARLSAVVLTHGHLDHIRDAAELGVEVFIHPEDAFMLNAGGGLPEHSRLLFDASSMAAPDSITHLRHGESIEFAGYEFAVQHAPGHSPGSVLLIADELVFSGDVIFRGSIGRTDLPFSDQAAMTESLRGPVWDLDDSLAVLPGHGPTTTMRVERATNPFLREANTDRIHGGA